jgi:hypothetical protein
MTTETVSGTLSADIAIASMNPKAKLILMMIDKRPDLVASTLDDAMRGLRENENFTEETDGETLIEVRAEDLRIILNLALCHFAGRIVPGDGDSAKHMAAALPGVIGELSSIVDALQKDEAEDEKANA